MLKVELVFPYQECSAEEMFFALEASAPEIGLEPDDYSSAHEVLEAEGSENLRLSGRIMEIDSGSIANHAHDYFRFKSTCLALDKVETLVEAVIGKLPLLQAFIHDEEYYFWQNARDPLEYEAQGRSHEHLPKVSNGLPFPLEQLNIDTSSNPGRYILKRGFREAVSSPMWIRHDFVKDLRSLGSIEGVNVFKNAGLLKLRHPCSPFNKSSGMQGDIQNKLRHSIYGV